VSALYNPVGVDEFLWASLFPGCASATLGFGVQLLRS
jgi:hypothetical protein